MSCDFMLAEREVSEDILQMLLGFTFVSCQMVTLCGDECNKNVLISNISL